MTTKEYWSQDWTKHWLAPIIWMSIGVLISMFLYFILSL